MTLTIVPTRDYGQYKQEGFYYAKIKVNGWVKRYYREEVEPGVVPPPCLLPMGGILARVTPKQRVKLHLWENQQESQPGVVAVEGELDPQMMGELVNVEMEDPAGRDYILQLTTNSAGRFAAAFDLTTPPGMKTEGGPEEEFPLPGVYVAKALIVNSPHVAQAESNAIYITR